MELIATARFKKAMDRATAATAYTNRITQLVRDLIDERPGSQPSAAGSREKRSRTPRCWCSPPIAACAAATTATCSAPASIAGSSCKRTVPNCRLEISGKRGIAAFKFRGITPTTTLHALRRQADVRRSRRARQSLPGRVHHRQARSARRGLHEVSKASPGNKSPSKRCCRSAASPTRRLRQQPQAEASGRRKRSTNSCRRPKASWKKSSRPASRSSCSSASSIRP